MFVVPTDVAGLADPRHRDDGRQGGQRPLLHRLPPAGRRGGRGRGAGLAPAHGRAEPRADDPRRADARSRASRVRRHARLRQGAQAVRPADRIVPGAAPPHRRQRHRARGHETARARHRRRRSTRTPRRCSRARRRWPSSRRPSSPSTSRSRGCRCWAATATPPSTAWSGLLRLSVVSTVYGGTSEIQRDIIGKTLGPLDRAGRELHHRRHGVGALLQRRAVVAQGGERGGVVGRGVRDQPVGAVPRGPLRPGARGRPSRSPARGRAGRARPRSPRRRRRAAAARPPPRRSPRRRGRTSPPPAAPAGTGRRRARAAPSSRRGAGRRRAA